MEILWWLAAPLAVTALAMLWSLWSGRPRREPANDDERRELLRAALVKPLPERARRVVTQVPERPSGIVVRPSQRRRS